MISENADRYENVIIRNNKEIGINTFGLDYLVSLEKEIERKKKILRTKTRLHRKRKAKLIKLRKEITNKQERLELLNSIIKEAREYIQDRYDGEVLTHTFDKDNVKELLEILDKVEEDK